MVAVEMWLSAHRRSGDRGAGGWSRSAGCRNTPIGQKSYILTELFLLVCVLLSLPPICRRLQRLKESTGDTPVDKARRWFSGFREEAKERNEDLKKAVEEGKAKLEQKRAVTAQQSQPQQQQLEAAPKKRTAGEVWQGLFEKEEEVKKREQRAASSTVSLALSAWVNGLNAAFVFLPFQAAYYTLQQRREVAGKQ